MRRTLILVPIVFIMVVGLLPSGPLWATAQDSTPSPSGMTVEASQQLLDRYLEALLSGGDFGQYLAEDAAIRFMDTGAAVVGRQQIVDAIITLHTVQFDAAPELVSMSVGAGTAGLEVLFVGTHTDEFAGIPATGMEVEVPYVAFYDMADDLITEIRLYGLATGLVGQLSAGAIATPVG